MYVSVFVWHEHIDSWKVRCCQCDMMSKKRTSLKACIVCSGCRWYNVNCTSIVATSHDVKWTCNQRSIDFVQIAYTIIGIFLFRPTILHQPHPTINVAWLSQLSCHFTIIKKMFLFLLTWKIRVHCDAQPTEMDPNKYLIVLLYVTDNKKNAIESTLMVFLHFVIRFFSSSSRSL